MVMEGGGGLICGGLPSLVGTWGPVQRTGPRNPALGFGNSSGPESGSRNIHSLTLGPRLSGPATRGSLPLSILSFPQHVFVDLYHATKENRGGF